MYLHEHFQGISHMSVLQCVAVRCSVLQRVAVWCSMLQCGAVCCSMLQCGAVCCSVLQCVAVCCSVLQCVAVCCSVLQCVAACCSVLQRVAVCCSVFGASKGSHTLTFCFWYKVIVCLSAAPSNFVRKGLDGYTSCIQVHICTRIWIWGGYD